MRRKTQDRMISMLYYGVLCVAGGIRVPAIVRWPGVVSANTVVRALTSSLDWMPTFASLAGYHLDPGTATIMWSYAHGHDNCIDARCRFYEITQQF